MRAAFTLVLGILIGFLFLLAVYALPVEPMAENVRASVPAFNGEWAREDSYETLVPGYRGTQLDNSTDAAMLLHAVYEEDAPLARRAANGGRYVMNGNAFAALLTYGMSEDASEMLGSTIARYWHGYLVYLTPLMLVFSYSQIRLINGVFQTALALLLCWLLYKRGKKQCILPLLLVLCFWMPVVQAKCLQYSACHYLMLFGCIALVWNKDRLSRVEAVVFFLLGVGTAYIDYLTYPVVVLGIPLALYYVLRQYGGFWEDVGKGVKLSLTWAVGYVGMWA